MGKIKIFALILAMLGLTACGGGGKNEDDKTVNLTGSVADGYLVGAKVCLDKNENGECDADEPSTITIEKGAYTLSGVNKSDVIKYPIVVEVSVDTVDEDTNEKVGKNYVMSAPANSGGFVSPMTTMVHGKLQSNPALSLKEAEDSVIKTLGFNSALSLFEDYVAAKGDTENPNASDYADLHNIARVTASVIAENFEAVKASAKNEDVAINDLMLIIVKQVVDKLDTIAENVAEAAKDSNGLLMSDKLTEISNSIASTIDIENIAAKVAENALVEESTLEEGLMDWVANGFVWLSADSYSYSYGVISKDNNSNTINEKIYNYNNGNWVLDNSSNEPYEDIRLTSAGWKSISDSDGISYSLTSDGRLNFKDPSTSADLFFMDSVLTSDIAGDNISQFLTTSGDEELSAFGVGVNDNSVFSSGAEAYRAAIKESESYGIEYNYCGENQAAYTLTNGTNCAVVMSGATPLQELNSVIGATHSIGWQLTVTISGAADAVTGSAIFTYHAPNQSTADIIEETWTRKTLNGEEMIIMNIPNSLREHLWDDYGVSKVFYSMFDGYVRLGWLSLSKTAYLWLFNQAAFSDLKINFSPNIVNEFVANDRAISGVNKH